MRQGCGHPGEHGCCHAATGLEELICPTPEAYRQRAIALGRQPAELQRLRRQLLERRSN